MSTRGQPDRPAAFHAAASDRRHIHSPAQITIPPRRVDRIELGPRAEFSDAALRQALALGVPVAFTNSLGDTIGMLAAPVTVRAGLHLAQARHTLDPTARLDLARRIVDGRLRGQRAQLRRWNRTRKDDQVVAAAVTITGLIRRLPVATDVPELMGLEGAAAAAYWPAFGRCLEHGWRFQHRRRRPSPDPVNLALSFLSALLHRDLAAFAARHGLHPAFGVLHTPRDAAIACVSDLIEEFRAPLIEALTLYLFNNRLLKPEMFETHAPPANSAPNPAPPDDPAPQAPQTHPFPCRIHPAGRQALVRGYEHWLDRPIRGPDGTRRLWRRLAEYQVIAYARHILGEQPYQPCRLDY